MGTPSTVSDLSALLKAWGGGDLTARDQLIPMVYEELRRRARAYFRREHVGHTLEPTALVHEAYLRLIKQDRIAWENRAQFYGVAAQMMHRILVDHARARNMPKRSGQWGRVPLVDFAAAHQTPEVDVLDLHAALDELASFDARKSRIAEARFFGGLSLEETSHVLAPAATEPAAGRVIKRFPALARERRLWAVAVSVLTLTVAGLASVLYRAQQSAPARVHIAIAIPQKGAVGFEVGSGIADAVRQASGDLDVTTQALEGSIGPARLLDAGQAQLGLVNSLVAFHSVKTERVLGHRAKFAGAAVLNSNPAQILVRRDTPIASVQDLRGKRVSVGPPGWGEGFNSGIMLSHFGLGPDDVTIIHKDVEPSLEGVLDGSLDAYIGWRGVPLAEISKAMASGRLRFLVIDRELVEGLRLNHPFLIPLTIPKGTYVHQDASVSTVSSKMLLVASTSVPPRVVDEVLAAIATYIPDLIARHPIASEIDLKRRPTVAEGMSIELHPGAEMFYQRTSRP